MTVELVTVNKGWLSELERHATTLVWLLSEPAPSPMSQGLRDAAIAHACDTLTDLLADS